MSRVCRIALESPRGFPAVDDGHFEVHQDDVRLLGSRHLAPFLAVLRRQNLEIAQQLEPHLDLRCKALWSRCCFHAASAGRLIGSRQKGFSGGVRLP
jgi:hypothetical protein